MKTYTYRPFCSKIPYCPVVITKGKLHYEGEPEAEDPEDMGLSLVASSCDDGWGYIQNLDIFTKETFPMPNRLSLRYITMNDGRCYALETDLDQKRADELWQNQEQEHPNRAFSSYVIGTAPFGGVAIWLRGRDHSVLLHWLKSDEVPMNLIEKSRYGWTLEMEESEVISREELDDNMKQYCYRYVALEEFWDNVNKRWVEYPDDNMYYDDLDIDSIEDHRTDGTFNYIKGDESQLEYHTTGKPVRITIRWHAGSAEYFAHIWLVSIFINQIFNAFFSERHDTKVDIMLRLDPDNQAYQLALRGNDNPQPFIIPWYAYQLIVFKNGEEHFTSPNYILEDGQWSWLWRKKEKAPENGNIGNGQQ